MTAPSHESLVRLLFAAAGVVTGVASTVTGSWISSKIHVYHENRKVHLDEIKQKVLLPIRESLSEKYAALVQHKTFAVREQWGTRRRIEGASVIQDQIEQGPSLVVVIPNMHEGVDSTLYADTKKEAFRIPHTNSGLFVQTRLPARAILSSRMTPTSSRQPSPSPRSTHIRTTVAPYRSLRRFALDPPIRATASVVRRGPTLPDAQNPG